MRKSLADRIEQYIKVLIARSEDKQIEIQRAELAETFCCVPSQVTYVLTTRFTEKAGYLTESRRGGGGYVRISEFGEGYIDYRHSHASLQQYIDELRRQELLNEREAMIVKYIAGEAGKTLPLEYQIRVNESILSALRELIEPGR